MNPTEVRTKSDDELKESLIGLRKEAFNLRFQRASGQLENTARMRGIRREIARIKTIMTERRAQGGAKPVAASASGTKSKTAPAKKAKTAKSKAKSA
jgi:large subunit ribosomal protein L29